MRVLPWDWTRFLSVERDGSALKRPLPVWRCNQRGQVVPMRIVRLDGKFYFDSSVNNGIENGDSGSPVFIGLEQPVLIGVTKTRAGGGSLAGNWKAVQTWATEVKEAVW
jgi:hypothetical protein